MHKFVQLINRLFQKWMLYLGTMTFFMTTIWLPFSLRLKRPFSASEGSSGK